MLRTRECIGIALLAFGAGIVLGILFQSILFPLLLALISIGVGCICMKCG